MAVFVRMCRIRRNFGPQITLAVWHVGCRPRGRLHHGHMLVCIVKVPPARMLEGMDLRPYRLRRDEIRELPRPVAEVLLAWGYATTCVDRRTPGNPRIRANRRPRDKK